ncbi:MAG: hypothetical protein LVO36_03020, partial [Nitrosopumilus sp. (ex Thoosa mismalolli)]|nr:hypothetical protein [Nitrosopumilus sp. (ex Thoosa mismalolli)]
GISSFLLLARDLNLVLQHGHVLSSVKKKNAHREHHFCPILYLKLFVNEVDFILSQIPLQTCTMDTKV